MNCKQGDVAIAIKGVFTGRIVTCTKLLGPKRFMTGHDSFVIEPAWAIDKPLRNSRGILQDNISDEVLRPIRPSEGRDETLSWKDVPKLKEKSKCDTLSSV